MQMTPLLCQHFKKLALRLIAELADELNSEMSRISHWLHSNKLLLNAAKSRFIVVFKHPIKL